MTNYSKKELVENLALHSDVAGNSNAAAGRIVEHIIKDIKDNVAEGKQVDVSGLCSFKPEVQAAKTGIVPGSNPPKQYNSPEKKIVKIKPAASFKTQVSDGL